MNKLVSDADLSRARHDPEFRQQLLAANLDRLLGALNRMRRESGPSEEGARQLQEGADLAVQLADRLQNGGAENAA